MTCRCFLDFPTAVILAALALPLLGALRAEAQGPAAPAREPVGAVPVEPFIRAEGASSAELGTVPSATVEPVISTRESPFGSLWESFAPVASLLGPGDPGSRDRLVLTINTNVGYDDNVFTTNIDRIASGTAGLGANLAYNLGTERLKLATALSLGTTYYDNRPGDDTDYNGSFSASADYRVNRRLQLTGNIAVSYLSQPDPTLIGGVTRFSGDYTVVAGGLSVGYSIRPRLSVRGEFRSNTVEYTEEAANQSLGFTEQNYILGLEYLLTPRVTLTSEYRYNPLSYYETDQNSIGQILTFGFNLSVSPKLLWTFQAGAEFRRFENSDAPEGAASEYFGPFLESRAEYGFAPGSLLAASLRYGTEPSGVAGISIRETLRGSLSLRYAFAARLSSEATLSYQQDNFDQPGENEDFAQTFITASLGLRYRFNQSLSLSARYDYSAVVTEQEINEYTRSVTTLGLEILF